MKKFNIKKATSSALRSKLEKINRLENGDDKYFEIAEKFSGLAYDINKELNRRNRAAIFRAACQVLKNRYSENQFSAAANYADAVINGCEYFSNDSHHEISRYDTKDGTPFIVDFD